MSCFSSSLCLLGLEFFPRQYQVHGGNGTFNHSIVGLVGGEALQPEYVKETIDIIIAAIIYLSAFALLMREMITKIFRERTEVLVVDEPSENKTLTNGDEPADDNPPDKTGSEEADIK